jgi:hypothetical protein
MDGIDRIFVFMRGQNAAHQKNERRGDCSLAYPHKIITSWPI